MSASDEPDSKDAVKFIEAPRLAGLALARLGAFMRRTAVIARNREIFAGYRAGQTTKQLAQTHGLTRHTVIAIIGIERHRLEVSIDNFYEEQRISMGLQTSEKP